MIIKEHACDSESSIADRLMSSVYRCKWDLIVDDKKVHLQTVKQSLLASTRKLYLMTFIVF